MQLKSDFEILGDLVRLADFTELSEIINDLLYD